MGKPQLPSRAKLFVGIIGADASFISEAQRQCALLWGAADLESDLFPFALTSYYEQEMGRGLIKKFISFKDLILRDSIASIKLGTNDLEEEIRRKSGRSGRPVNLDPGYVTLSNVVLATTKDYRHRIYAGQGIYLENTLYYDRKKNSYAEWEWTYPDYATGPYKEFFNRLRNIYKDQLKKP